MTQFYGLVDISNVDNGALLRIRNGTLKKIKLGAQKSGHSLFVGLLSLISKQGDQISLWKNCPNGSKPIFSE
jgi:hypothetical protein